jgi:type IV secretion system protein VirB3
MSLPTIPLHKSLIRPMLFMGGDRELVLCSMLIAFTMIFVLMDWTATCYGLGLWLAALALLRKLAKIDPLMRDVYRRHIQYQSVYRASRTPWQDGQRRPIRRIGEGR